MSIRNKIFIFFAFIMALVVFYAFLYVQLGNLINKEDCDGAMSYIEFLTPFLLKQANPELLGSTVACYINKSKLALNSGDLKQAIIHRIEAHNAAKNFKILDIDNIKNSLDELDNLVIEGMKKILADEKAMRYWMDILEKEGIMNELIKFIINAFIKETKKAKEELADAQDDKRVAEEKTTELEKKLTSINDNLNECEEKISQTEKELLEANGIIRNKAEIISDLKKKRDNLKLELEKCQKNNKTDELKKQVADLKSQKRKLEKDLADCQKALKAFKGKKCKSEKKRADKAESELKKCQEALRPLIRKECRRLNSKISIGNTLTSGENRFRKKYCR